MNQSDAWNHCLEHAVLSDIGLRRANNQDSYAVSLAGDQADFQQRGHFFMVADGMGAHAAGELASKIATDVVSLTYRKLLEQSPPEALLSAVLEANRQIHTRGQASADFRGMGTTATSLVLLPAGALVAHVGDSRAYRLRGGRIEQLTFDHSLVWEMQAAGQLPKDVPGYISKNIITRSLGPNATVQIDLEGPHPLQAGDVFLLCSDGLSNQVKDDEIGMTLDVLPPDEAVQALVDLACLRGGPDNITAVLVRVLGPQVASNAEDAASAATVKPRPIHPLIWTVLGVSSLASAWMFMLQRTEIALACLLGAVGAAAAAMFQRYGGGRSETPDARRFGRGPYVAAECRVTPELLSRLSDIIRQLRDAAVSENWRASWSVCDELLARADTAAAAKDYAQSASCQLRAISSIMAQLRRRGPDFGDSGVLI